MKKLSLLLVIILLTSLVACGNPTVTPTDTATPNTTASEAPIVTETETEIETEVETEAETEVETEAETKTEPETTPETEESPETTSAETEGELVTGDVTFSGPYVITTCGQSPGAVQINMSAKMAELEATVENTITAEEFDPDSYKTLIVTTGTSMKGMGAAGTDVDAEIERCVALIEKAKEAGLTIIGAHVEGMARRTDSADEASIEAIMPLADVILVVEESDSDGYFTKFAEENDKELIVVENALQIGEQLK